MSTAESQSVYSGKVGFFGDDIAPCFICANGPSFEASKRFSFGEMVVFRFVAPANGFITSLHIHDHSSNESVLSHENLKQPILKGEVWSFATEKVCCG